MQRRLPLGHINIVAACTLALGACSAQDYSEPISTFASAATDADSALKDLDTTVTNNYTDFLARRALSTPGATVLAAQKECEPGSSQCTLVIQYPNEPPEQYPPQPLLGNMVAVMSGIRTYAQNLAALANDDSAAKAAADVNATLGSIQSLANTVAKLDAKGTTTVPDFATPVGAGVNWLLGQYANQVKLEGLRVATKQARPVVDRAAAIFSSAALFGSDPQRKKLSQTVRGKIDAYQDSNQHTMADLNEVAEAAQSYNVLLQAQPAETFKKMGDAHAALADALNNPNLSLSQMIAKVNEFAAQVQQLSKIVKDLAALSQEPAKVTK